MLKKIWKHGSTAVLITIILILIIPSWRIAFQGWFQGVFMGEMHFEQNRSDLLPENVKHWRFFDMNQQMHQLSEFSDRPILLSFWATWCPPCRAELKELEELKGEFDSAVYFLSISEEPYETIQKSGLSETYDFLYYTSNFHDFFKISAFPTLCIIDQSGKLIFKHSGAGGLDNEKNRGFIRDLLENG